MAKHNLFSTGASKFKHYDGVLTAHADDGGSLVEGKAAVSAGGEAPYVSVGLGGSAASHSGESEVKSAGGAVVKSDDTTVTVTGEAEASGKNPLASIDLSGTVEKDMETAVTGLAHTKANAVAGEDGAASATTSADAELAHNGVVIAEDHDQVSDIGASAMAKSMAILSTMALGAVEFDPLEAGLHGLGIGISLGHADWSL